MHSIHPFSSIMWMAILGHTLPCYPEVRVSKKHTERKCKGTKGEGGSGRSCACAQWGLESKLPEGSSLGLPLRFYLHTEVPTLTSPPHPGTILSSNSAFSAHAPAPPPQLSFSKVTVHRETVQGTWHALNCVWVFWTKSVSKYSYLGDLHQILVC